MTNRAWIALIVTSLLALPAAAQTGNEEEDAQTMSDGGGAAGAPADTSLDDSDDSVQEEVAGPTEPIPSDSAIEDDDAEADLANPEESGILSDEQVLAEEQLGGRPVVRSGTDPYEDPSQNYYFLGFFYNHHFTPDFIIELFTDAAPSANNPALGLEFTYRKDGFDIITRAWYQQFFAEGAFRGSGDDLTETEIIDSNLRTVFAGVDFMWSTEFNDIVSIQYGIGLGIGVVFGDLIRDEAFETDRAPDGFNNGTYGRYSRCNDVVDPVAEGWCDPTRVGDGMEGGHFNVKARNWTDGGSVPVVWFRAALPRLALRIKPIKQLMFRVEGGFDLFSGFFVGGSVNVGLGGGN